MPSLEFQKATYALLAEKTGIAKSRWSQYFNSKRTLNEKTLNAAAIKLNMEPGELLQAINERRQRLLTKKLSKA